MSESYVFTNGCTMCRQEGYPYHWVLRDASGAEIERDKYRHDLIDRYRLTPATSA